VNHEESSKIIPRLSLHLQTILITGAPQLTMGLHTDCKNCKSKILSIENALFFKMFKINPKGLLHQMPQRNGPK
jgi:hypothetical protein